MTPAEKDLARARRFAARWIAETERREPPELWPATDANLAQVFAGCVRPAEARLYPLIRAQLFDPSWLEV